MKKPKNRCRQCKGTKIVKRKVMGSMCEYVCPTCRIEGRIKKSEDWNFAHLWK